ncbi:uncharacterized protein LOC110975760 [Acanthaster planci]|uniref:Uncharacterized protein LOC110975760 n=1 Tax=Acanthaster planci TaxID=133434 RepID=A0A8B7XTN4_ACAPL|nr:uncharacterized protein LOC110975760 [Acanthaster planci]XP_022084221.1 uncharacterized protein LOC110975760 [Acanthaster planci]XP_022084232.1 uncharacterized protein LOC110975760 [Acanthaster planci]
MAPSMLLVFLSVFCLIAGDVHAQPDPNVCTPHTSEGDGPSLPSLPEQFMLRVEANILGWNNTVEVVEYYDYINNRGAVNNIYNGNISQTFINYATREIIRVYSGDSCTVGNVTAKGFNIFGFTLQNGTAHIASAADIFRFGASYNETYMGTTYVRGIPADHWQSCWYFEETNATSLLDYYFTVPGYKTANGDTQVPLRLALNGTASNKRFINGHLVPVNGTHSYSHVYEFFDVQFHPKFADRTFEPPLGVVCPGRKSLKPLPKLPDHFFQSLEVVIPPLKRVFYVSEVYDYKGRMAVYYYSLRNNGTSMRTPYRSLDDFNTGLTYRVNMDTGHCNITPISLYSPDAESPDNVHVQIKSVASFFNFEVEDWQYQGVSELRDMQAESWIAKRTDWKPTWIGNNSSFQTNSTWEFFFTTDSWNTQGGLNMSTYMPTMSKVEWNLKMKNGTMRNGSFIVNYFHYDAANVDPSHFDLSPCFDSNNGKELAFDILETGIYNMVIANNTFEFYHGVVNSLATTAGISPSRIANVLAEESNDKVTTVFFTLLGVPDVKGNAVDMIKQPSLTDATVTLEMTINTALEEKFLYINFHYNSTEKTLTVKPDSLRNTFGSNKPNPGGSQGFSTGAFVGFGIGMLLVGTVLGVGILLFIFKKKDLSIPYNVQS